MAMSNPDRRNKLARQFESLVNQLQLFTGIHTAEAALLADLDSRLSKVESVLADLIQKHDQLHNRVAQDGSTLGEHLRTHK